MNGASRPRTQRNRTWLIVFGVALVVRLAFLLSVVRVPCFSHPVNEGQRYLLWAHLIRTTDWLPMRPPLDEAPGYPYLLALVTALGESVWLVFVIQALVGAATAALLACLCARASGQRRFGVAAGLVCAAHGPFIAGVAEVNPVTLFLFALVLAAAATVDAVMSGSEPRRFWWAGLAWAGAVAVRSEAVLALPWVVLWGLRSAGRRAGLALAACVLAYGVVMGAASWRASGHFVPLTLGAGFNLWLGNSALSDGVSPFLSDEQEARWAAIVAGSERDPVEQDRRLRAAALDEAGAAPAATVRRLLHKTALTFFHRELPNTVDLEWQAAQSLLFRIPFSPLPLGFGLLLTLAAFGLARSGAEQRCWPLLVGVAAVGVICCVVFFVNGRFRAPLALSLMPLAARGLLEAGRRETWQAGRRIIPRLVVPVAALVLTFADPLKKSGYHIAELDVNVAQCERAAGHPERAVERLNRALAVSPNDGRAWLQLALAHEQQGHREAAIAAFRRGRPFIEVVRPLLPAAATFAQRHGL